MKNQWNLLKETREADSNDIEALAEVPADSPWFSGHFPGEPILPGIALVYAVKQAIHREAQKKGERLELHTLKRIRFMQPVRPGDQLSLNIRAADADGERLFHFKIFCRDTMVSSGMIAAKKMK